MNVAGAYDGLKAAASTPSLKHLDMPEGAPLRLPKPLSDQFPVRVCSLYINRRVHPSGLGLTRYLVISKGAPVYPNPHPDISERAPLRIPKPLSDQFSVRVCSCAF